MTGLRSHECEAPNEISRRLTARITEHGMSRREARGRDIITSVGTERRRRESGTQYQKWRKANGIPKEEQDYARHLNRYLSERAMLVTQKTLDCDRRTLEMVFHLKLAKHISQCPIEESTRSYRPDEVRAITQLQSDRYANSTWLAYYSGMRAHEFATLAPPGERAPAAHRTWHAGRFWGLHDHAVYTVAGKGGLVREVALPCALAMWLERHRRPLPVRVRDREVFYESRYDVPFGRVLSQNFDGASKRALGWSHAIHGLRHSFAKRRLATMLRLGAPPELALQILSQELGHFRIDITLHYLR